jgi:inner membrane protein
LDTLTHALSGALLARATAPNNAPRPLLMRRVAAGFLACAAPDLDFVAGFFGPLAYIENHRGVTHSLVLLPLWALLYSWILAKILRESRGWRALYGVTALGLGLHIAADVITSFGTMVLAPLSNWRAAIGTTFIIDLWFSGIIVAGLVVSAIFPRTRRPAVGAMIALVAYVCFQFVLKQHALDFARQYARAHGLGDAALAAEPRPVSPFNWTVYVSDTDVHHFAHVNLIRREARIALADDSFIARLDSPYRPLADARWETRTRYGEGPVRPVAQEAWNAQAMAVFRWFAALPAFDGATADATCVWFIDLRFLAPGRGVFPFRFGACRDQAGDVWRLVAP